MTIPEEIEQLKTQLDKAPDEENKAELILKLLSKYTSMRSTDSKPFIDRLLQWGEKNNSTYYKAWGFLYNSVFKNLSGEDDAALNFAQQALSLFEQLNDLKGLAKVCNLIGIIHSRQGNLAEALKSYLRALQILGESGDKLGMATPYANISVIYEQQGNYPESLKNQMMALQIRRESGSKREMAESYNSLGVIHEHLGNYPEALNNYFQALMINEEMRDDFRTAGVHDNIGTIHLNQGDYPAALSRYLLAFKIRKKSGNKLPLATSYNAIGIIQTHQGNYQEALENFNVALQIGLEAGDKSLVAHSYNNIGTVYEHLEKYREALKNHFDALQKMDELGNKYGKADCCIGIGKVHQKLGDYKEGMKYLFLAFGLGREIDNKNVIRDSALLLANGYQSLGDFETALGYYEKYHDLEKQLLGEEAQKQLTSLNFQHNMEQKERDAAFEKQKREEAERFSRIVEEKNIEILRSINYAAKIQNAILPTQQIISRYLTDPFVLNLSKDIVSGDFYFVEADKNYTYFGVVDCTGHGVPGAMVSIVGYAGLKRAIDEFRLSEPAEILQKLNELVAGTLHQSDDEETISDGLDIALCRLDLPKNKLLFAGANRPLWVFREGVLLEFKPAKIAIGGMKYAEDQNKRFSQEEIKLQSGDTIYIFSDGYADQFGGEKGKKLMLRGFKELLLSVQHKTMVEQKDYLKEYFKEWQGENEQVDDVLVVGISI